MPAALFSAEGRWLAYWMALASDAWAIGLAGRGYAVAAVILAVASRGVFFGICTRLAGHRVTSTTGRRLPAYVGMFVYAATLLIQATCTQAQAVQGLFAAFPAQPTLVGMVESVIDRSVDWLTAYFQGAFSGLTLAMNWLLNALQAMLSVVPWPIAILALAFVAWQKGGIRFAFFTACTLVYFGLFGFWPKTIETLSVVLAAFVVCLIVGVPTGVAAAKHRGLKAVILPCLDVMQTMPSFVYLLPAVAFFSIGKPPALVATVIFAVPPLIRLTCLGIEQVPHVVQEAMYAHGATGWQVLVKAELPLAAPSIRAGVNQTIMLSLAMAVISSLIGGGGLGYDVLFALQNVQYGKGVLAGLAIVLSAIVFDRLVRRSGVR